MKLALEKANSYRVALKTRQGTTKELDIAIQKLEAEINAL